ncbi:PREDICTED: rhomboid-related protein 4 [Apaloderma vittatum]|nr:PREDICTED: rhomboid-related protein 4 [Apaloderma vittatum]
MQRRQGRVGAGLLLLLYQISQVGLQNIPGVTLGVLVLNIFLFLTPLWQPHEACLSVREGFHRRDWQRLLLAPFHHADDWHLYYNMVSMLWKGIMLEKKLKSTWFAYIIAVFSVLVGVVYMVLEFMLVKVLDDPSYEMNCAVGFSGVLFALKVLNNYYNPGRVSSVLGWRIPSKYACWVELVAIHLISPGTSFAGHLAGILVGLLYTMGPLKKIMKACAGGISSFADPARPRHYYSEYYGYSGGQYRVPRSYYDYTGGLTEEEQLERAVLNSLSERDSGGAAYNERRPYGFWFPPEQHSEEEMRRQRLRRFEKGSELVYLLSVQLWNFSVCTSFDIQKQEFADCSGFTLEQEDELWNGFSLGTHDHQSVLYGLYFSADLQFELEVCGLDYWKVLVPEAFWKLYEQADSAVRFLPSEAPSSSGFVALMMEDASCR